jgi:hypothetical protein
MRRNLTCLVLLLFLQYYATAQKKVSPPAANLRDKNISTRTDSVKLDTLSVVPGSFSIPGIAAGDYQLDETSAILVWKRRPKADSVQVRYRVFGFSFARDYYHKDIRQLYHSYMITPYIYKGGEASASRFIDFGSLNYNGSFGRGISFGNNQDVVVNSNLNLQLSGMLADSIELVAAISDNNVPFQPEGNTESLQNFDKVFIQFSKQRSRLILGDYDMQQTESHFMHFFQRLEGVAFNTAFMAGSPKDSNAIALSGAVTKGKFAQDIFQGQEGNQGPYHLTGANGEQYLIVLAGTERVFLNGILMRRGQDQDYIIDYNTAEVSFTPRQLITNDTRIQVEFEYTNNNYLNSQLYLTDSWNEGQRLKLTFNAFSNQDAKSSPISQPLSANQIFFLGQIGDSISKAYYPSVVRDTFSSAQIQYAMIDTVVAGKVFDSIFVYNTNPDSAMFGLSFSLVGQGNGNYSPLASGTNGQAYQWIAPINDVPQGSYAPVILLVTPKKQQLFTLGADYRINDHSSLKTELALSNNDINLFSRIQKSGDLGTAASAAYQFSNVVTKTSHSQTELHSAISYEYTASTFRPLEPFRNVEFYRDWSLGLNNVLPAADEHLIDGSVGLRKTDLGSITYEFAGLFRGTDYTGVRNILTGTVSKAGFIVNGEFNITTGNGLLGKSVFLRPHLEISRTFKKWDGLTLGSSFAMENNRILTPGGDSLSFQSFAYNTWQVYLKTAEARKNRIAISFTLRTDSYPLSRRMVQADLNRILNLSGQLGKNPHQQLRWDITYHHMSVADSALSGQQPDEGILGRLEYLVNVHKGFLTSSTVYETGSGQQAKQSYTYVQVPAGQGQYVWIDYNHDSIQQVNEFSKAVYQDQANFIRVYTPSGQYVRSNYVQLNQSISLNPRQLFNARQLHGMASFVSRFSSQSSFQINRDEQAGGFSKFNPFGDAVQDTSLISINSLITNAVFFNRLSPVWNLEYTNSFAANKSLMTYGFQSSNTYNHTAKGRWNFTKRLSAEMNVEEALNAVYAPSYANLNYRISEQTLIPQLDYTYNSTMRLTLNYTWDQKLNSLSYGGESSLSNAVTGALKYNVLTNSTLDVQVTYNQIRFDGQSNSTVGYTMLDGLLPGSNMLWQVSYTRRIAGNIEMDLQYLGRKPGDMRVIHTGQVSVRALF